MHWQLENSTWSMYTLLFKAMPSNQKLSTICKNQNIYICSDSKSSIEELVSPSLVMDCNDVANKLGSNNNVTITWVHGHLKVEGNEVTDQLAGLGSRSNALG